MSAYTLHTDEGLVMVTLTGRLDFDTISALLDELDGLAVAALPDHLSVLIDETDAGPGLLSAGHIRSWISRWKRATALKQGRLAVIAPDLVMYGLNRMAQGIAGDESDEHLHVFRSREEALAWLRGPPPTRPT
jgi:hypothetical protein